MTPSLWTIPFGAPFLDVLARAWLAEPEPERGLILLPTRRAARAMADAFLRVSDGAALLLPRITALGAIDEAPLALAGALDVPPAIGENKSLVTLAALVMAKEAMGLDRAWVLAAELASLMDEAARAEIDLPTALSDATGGEHAQHWQRTLEFLGIVTRLFPEHLRENRLTGPVERQVALLDAQARAWSANGMPGEKIWAAGIAGGFPAAARLLRVIASRPGGRVVLHGLDRTMTDAVVETLCDPAQAGHPQAGLARLLTDMGARRDDVRDFPDADPPAAGARARALGVALLPAAETLSWRGTRADLPHVTMLRTGDEGAEAAAIAMILRDAIEVSGRTAALVTPDRDLAVRVGVALRRWGIVADDSAGEPLAATPPATFLRLLAVLLTRGFGSNELLAVLQHPLAAAGFAPAECRRRARTFELDVLRGMRGLGSLAALRRATAGNVAQAAFLDAIERCLAGADATLRAAFLPARDQLAALTQAAEALADTDESAGAARLWAGEEGNALAAALGDALRALADARLPDQPASTLPGLLDAILAPHVVRTRRAAWAPDGGAAVLHPNVLIWGLLEARLQTVDVIVLGGLVEGTWPAATDPGPWMSRPMRTRAGLDSPEARTGRAAHDFVAACCAGTDLVLSVPARRGGRPVVPSRWIARIEAFAAASGQTLASHPAQSWAASLDTPVRAEPAPSPAPRPPVSARPRTLSLSDVTLWQADPYAIYAKHILRLKPLKPLAPEHDAAVYGEVVHQAIALVLKNAAWPEGGPAPLARAMDGLLAALDPPAAIAAWWAPRFARIAEWVTDEECARRPATGARVAEAKGTWPVPGCALTVIARADRIERLREGGLAIVDYKTGTMPSARAVQAGREPQLPLEAAMARDGAFGTDWRGEVTELAYWKLSGDHARGKAQRIAPRKDETLNDLIAQTTQKLSAFARRFDNADCAYVHVPAQGRGRVGVYTDLARAAEWAGDDGDADDDA